MANKYYRNFILCGEIDYYCLICKEHFQSLVDVEKHTRWETHRKTARSQIRSPKFKKDAIFKIGEHFYCEVCNFITPDTDTITTHVGKDVHKTNKDKPKAETDIPSTKCKRDSGYVLVSDIILDTKDWHGIVGKECVTCGTGIYSIMQHISTPEHVLNLIDAEIVIDKDKCYRKIRKEAIFCFTCKVAVPLSDVENHWFEKEHCEKKASVFRATISVGANEDKKMELTKRLINAQSDHFIINLDKGVAVCKNCKSDLKLDFKAMLNHQKGHKEAEDKKKKEVPVISVECPSSPEEEYDTIYLEVQDHGKRRSELSKYGQDNFIKLNPGGSRGYCRLCHTTLSAHIRLFKEHVRGLRHRGYLELRGIKPVKNHIVPNLKLKPIFEYLESVFYSRPVHVLWLNKHYCVDIHSFILVSNVKKITNNNNTKCYACDTYYTRGEDLEHYKSEEHKRKFLAAKVLALKGEFVREIRPDIYHCGFCNKVYPFWEQMQNHLQSAKHTQKKNDKDLVLRIAQEWFDERILTKTSNHPDVFYIQFICLGILNAP